MPTKRSAAAKTGSHQSTLTFHGRSKVTKPGTRDPAGKAAIAEDSLVKPVKTKEEKEKDDEEDDEEGEDEDAEAVLAEQESAAPAETKITLPPAADETAVSDQAPKTTEKGKQATEEEIAGEMTEAQIIKYWREKEKERKAPRVHQEKLNVHEKVLREWDTSGQYGPGIGITRMKRWKRAQRLGLNPPIEVLAVLLMEQRKDNTNAERGHVDELMGSRFVDS